MKKILVMAFAVMLVWVAGVQNAAAALMDPVTFYVVDDNTGSPNDFVTLSFMCNSWQGSATLQISTW